MPLSSPWKTVAPTHLSAVYTLPSLLGVGCAAATDAPKSSSMYANFMQVFGALRLLQAMGEHADPRDVYATSYQAANHMAAASGSSVPASDHFGYMAATYPHEFGRADFGPAVPAWQGEGGHKGKTLLVHAVKLQGAGDVFQFAPLVNMAKDQGGFDTVVFEVPKRMVPLLEKAGLADVVVGKGDTLPAHDMVAPMMALPSLLGINLQTHRAPGAYLQPDWKIATPENDWINANIRQPPLEGELVVGLAWQGDTGNFSLEPHRSINLSQLHNLLSLNNTRFVCLQNPADVPKSPLAEQFAALGPAQRANLTVLPEGFDKAVMFGDTMHAMRAMNVVVSTDTGIAHAAGAAGARLVLLGQNLPELRYARAGQPVEIAGGDVKCPAQMLPYYDNATLLQQPKPGDWATVVTALHEELSFRQNRANPGLNGDLLPTRRRPLSTLFP